MPTKQIDVEHKEPEKHATPQWNAAIAAQLLQTLGKPGGFHSVQVRHLWGDHFRANVLVGADAASIRIAHSYFLVIASDEMILSSSPTIRKEY